MSLSKLYTLSTVDSLVRALANEIVPNKIQPPTIKAIINKNTLDIAEQLNGASAPDYGTTGTITDVASSVLSSYIKGSSYTSGTKNILESSHGLTSADVGKRIVYWINNSNISITEIVSIVDTNNFTVLHDLAVTGSGTINYAVFSAHSTTNVDISSLKIDRIIKVTDSINGLVSERNDLDFENLSIDTYKNSVLYNHFGETLYLFKGQSVTSWATLTLYYYRLPTLVSSDSDYIDMRDKHIPLLIDKCKLEVYEISKLAPPKELSLTVENRIQAIRNADAGKSATIQQKKESQ